MNSLERSMHPEKFDKVIEAIVLGKYSWACVLMLRFAGYNPLHYIPYSTYNRIVKDGEHKSLPNPLPSSQVTLKKTTQIQDLDHLEPVMEESQTVNGGRAWLTPWPW